MTGIPDQVLRSVARLQVRLCDNRGRVKRISGTGFWIMLTRKGLRGRQVLVTNAHNLDPRFKLGEDTTYKLVELQIELRKIRHDQGGPDRGVYDVRSYETKFFPVPNMHQCLHFLPNVDCALIFNPKLSGDLTGFKTEPISQTEIADQAFLSSKVNMMDLASFIGYPGDANSPWWDQTTNYPIARMASVASLPGMSFNNLNIKTKDVALVSGFSFSGSSGSPVILHQKGIPPSQNMVFEGYVPPKLIGIMSGHTLDFPMEGEMFRHSGLSYYTRSSSILSLIDTIPSME